MDEQVTLPKYILLVDEQSGQSAILPPKVLAPSSLAAAAGDSRINSTPAVQSAHTQTDETKK